MSSLEKQNLNYAVKDENGSIVTDTAEVLSIWRRDYQNLYISVDIHNNTDTDPILTDPDIDITYPFIRSYRI